MILDKQILIVEDDHSLSDQLTDMLSRSGYCCDQSFDGEDGYLKIQDKNYDLILLDVMLPKVDGYSLLKRLRRVGDVPVVMLTAKGAEQERIQGLTIGADDYIAKPFNPVELKLRIEAILRRSGQSGSPSHEHSLEIDGLQIDVKNKRAEVRGFELEFTPIQFKLLYELAHHRGEVLSKAYLYQQVLNRSLGAHDRSLDMHLSRLRRKLNDAGWNGERLQTAHGKGYCLI
ncbi:response regulator transcription factor [Neiella marina]|uniref:Response regulator transcription factor n=1 Tax=Neiella holothuriorum TaxID=2870530 RepID=A0ABS7EED8_9GAMM|nr:response regulator transcription factor [Neiella holothuriorum]MBW8190620.1 response regulator transcription factor [Neiella holothuriorum]